MQFSTDYEILVNDALYVCVQVCFLLMFTFGFFTHKN